MIGTQNYRRNSCNTKIGRVSMRLKVAGSGFE